MHIYTFRPPAPTVRTGTADAERWSGRPRMVCGKGVRVPLGIGSRFRPPAAAAEGASRGEHRHFGLSPTNERYVADRCPQRALCPPACEREVPCEL